MNSTMMSIYIPRMCINTCEHEIRHAFRSFVIGAVSRVDFIPIDKKPGFVENIAEDTAVKSAFVHFDCFYESADYIINRIKNGESYRLLLNGRDETNGYWILLKATNPAQNTMMNIHQVVDNCRHLERIVEAQQKQIEAQQKLIEKLTDTTMRVRDEVYQLFGGLFNQTTQREALNYHIGMLGIELDEGSKVTGDIKCDIWPTTRQGDKLEERLDNIDAVIRQIIGGIYCQRTQAGIIQNHMDVLDGREFEFNNRGEPIVDYPEDTHKHKYWPTTRQGDNLEERMQRIENMLMPKSARMAVIEEPEYNTEINVSDLCSGNDKISIRAYNEYVKNGNNISLSEYVRKMIGLNDMKQEEYDSDDEDHPLLATCANVTMTRGGGI